MSGRCYQTLIVQRSVSTRERTSGTRRGSKGNPSPVHVPLSKEAAETLQKVSEATRLPQEILAAEAIRRGIEALTAFSTNH